MSGRKKKIVGKGSNVSEILINVMSKENSASAINSVRSYGLSLCAASYGRYALLRDAIKSGQYDFSKFLLEQGIRVDCQIDGVSGLLHYAIEKGWAEFVHLLLEKHAPIDARDEQNDTPLHLAVKKGYSNIVKVLLNHNASVTAQTNEGFTPLFLALKSKREEIFQMLLKHACAKAEDAKDVSSGKDFNSTLLDRILLCGPSICDKVSTMVVNIEIQDKGISKIVDDLIDHGFSLPHECVTESLFVAAIQKSNTKLIENILESGFNLESAKYNHILLQAAVKLGCLDIIKLLLDSGLDVNLKDSLGRPPIFFALLCRKKDKRVEIMQFLVANGADIKKAPELLKIAVKAGLFEICKFLIENGADVNFQEYDDDTPLHLAVPKKKCDDDHRRKQKSKKIIDQTTRDRILELLLNNGADVSIQGDDGQTAFHRAVENGSMNAVRLFLDMGADVNLLTEDDETPLHLAASAGHAEILEILLAHKANVNVHLENGATPLHSASKNGHYQIVRTLCEKGACVNARQNKGWTPLHLAALGQRAALVRLLLNFDADVNARGKCNETALHCAFSGDPDYNEVVEVLLENGCDVNVETNRGHTAMDIAIKECCLNYASRYRGYDYVGTDYESRGFAAVSSDDYCTSDEEGDFSPDEYRPIVALQRHLVKLKVAGFHISEKNLFLLDYVFMCSGSTHEISDFEQKCKEEVNRMKKFKVNAHFFLLDVLVNSYNPAYARNKLLMQALESLDLKEFCIYEGPIRNNFKKSLSKLELQNSGQKSLDMLVKISAKLNGAKSSVLPDELLELIISYLDTHEIKSLICCGKMLKSQCRQ